MVASPLEAESEEVSEEVESALARLELRQETVEELAPLSAAPAKPRPAPLAPVSTELADSANIAQAMVNSGYWRDLRSAAQAIVRVLAGKELGIPPVASMLGIYILETKSGPRLQLSAQVMATLVKRSQKYDYRVRELDNQHARIEFLERVDGKWDSLGVSEYTIQDAQKAGMLNRGPWQQTPRNMLYARAMSNGVKWFCPEVTHGPTYAQGELEQDEEWREPPAES